VKTPSITKTPLAAREPTDEGTEVAKKNLMNFNGALILCLAIATGTAHAETVVATRDQAQSFKAAKSTIQPASSSNVMTSNFIVIKRTPAAAPEPQAQVAPTVQNAPAPAAPPATAYVQPTAAATPAPQAPVAQVLQNTPAPKLPPPISIAPPVKPAAVADAKPAYPKCTRNPAEAKAMMQDLLGMDATGITWNEDHPNGSKSSKMKVSGTKVTQLEMVNGDGKNLGSVPVDLCVKDGKITATFLWTGLNFDFTDSLKLKWALNQQGLSPSELTFTIGKAANGKIFIADQLTAYPDKRINSTFSAVTR